MNSQHGRRAIRNALKTAFQTASEGQSSVLPAPLVKNDTRSRPGPDSLTPRLSIMPESNVLTQEYVGGEGEVTHTLILEWSVWAPTVLDKGTDREDMYEAGLTEIGAVLKLDPTFGGVCVTSKPVRLEELDENFGRAGHLSVGFITLSILLDTGDVTQ